MSHLTKYTVLTPGCAPHPAELYESDRLSQVTKPELVRQIIGGTFNQFASGPQIDACRRFMQATDRYIDTTDANHRSGFLLGDEMGVGKTNTIALSIVQTIQEHINNHGTQGRHIAVVPKEALFEPLQISISNMASVTSTNINFLRIKDIFKKENDTFVVNQVDGLVVITYNGLGTHINRFLEWLQQSKTQIIVFDESHHVRNEATNSAKAGLLLHQHLPHSRMMFSSGTCAETVKDLHLVGIRTGLWTQYSFKNVSRTLNGRNFFIYIATQLVREGKYISRLLSTETTAEHIIKNVELSNDSINVYNQCAALMAETMKTIRGKIASDEKRLHLNARLYNMSLAFFREMMLFVRLDFIVKETMQYVKDGKSVVIAIQSTGESYAEREIQGIANTAINLIDAMDNKFPHRIWTELRDKWKGMDLPHQSILDIIVDSLGGLSTVADITGRSKYWVRDVFGNWVIKKRNKNQINIDRERFQNDELPVAIISRTANEGYNLHASKPGSNQRVMILGQQPWSARQERQLEARVARTGQTSIPLMVHIHVAQICELTITGRHASGSRNASSIIYGNQNIAALETEMEDVNTIRGVHACQRLIADLQDVVGTRTETIRKTMDMTHEQYQMYREDAIDRLMVVGALDCFKSEGVKRKFGDDDGEHDASDTDKNGSDSVRQFLNRILLLRIDTQERIAAHLKLRLKDVQDTSTHTKPIKPVCNIVYETTLNYGIKLLKLQSINKISDLEDTAARWYVDRTNSFACAIVVFGKVSWRITPRDCIPSAIPFYGYSETTYDHARTVWNKNSTIKYILQNVHVSDIAEMKSYVRAETPLQLLNKNGGGTILGFSIPVRSVDIIRDMYNCD